MVSTELGDATAAFYVAGYISRRISKSLKCSSCKEMCMQDGAIELLFHDNDSDITKEEAEVKDKFLELVAWSNHQTLCLLSSHNFIF